MKYVFPVRLELSTTWDDKGQPCWRVVSKFVMDGPWCYSKASAIWHWVFDLYLDVTMGPHPSGEPETIV